MDLVFFTLLLVKYTTSSYHKLKSELQRSLCTDKNKWLEHKGKEIDEYDRVKKSKKLFDQVKN